MAKNREAFLARRKEKRKAWIARDQNREKVRLAANAYYHANLEKCREYQRNRYHKKRDTSVADYRMKKFYGISLRDYEVMLAAQSGVCAICGKSPEENKKKLAVDHDHTTGAVRGLLCSMCNLLVGKSKDNQEILQKTIEYLRRNGVH